MITQDQSEVIEFLCDPANLGGHAVQRIDTHASHVFLSGNRAWKLKRAVRLPYLDFSTAGLRLAACEKEVVLNRVAAPGIYLGVRRLTHLPDGGICLDGDGPLADAVVEMVRFRQEYLLDDMAARNGLEVSLMPVLATEIAGFHGNLAPVHGESGSENIAAVLSINEAGFATSRVFPPAEIDRLSARFRQALERHAPLLDMRERDGKVRRCHGDLHLRNICLMQGKPVLFDCIEFSDRIATIDILYDLAFLLMDLWHRGLEFHANQLVNRYLDETGDDGGFVLLPFFIALRAAVRAHVTATQIAESGNGDAKLLKLAREYFGLAESQLGETAPLLVAIGGLSGSGKTTVSERLAPVLGLAPGARTYESDRIRKAMFGVPAQERLPQSAYAPEVGERVYKTLSRKAIGLAGTGAPVIANAVFAREEERTEIAEQARLGGVPFTGFWLDVPPSVLRGRVISRKPSPSDATAGILERQLGYDTGRIGWITVDAAGKPDIVVREIAARIVA